ncbi:cytochrome P450 306a1 isoform X2 [Zootermopsis nevadensis]|uniref:Cytochrome P450 306a1 n=2 Tax=Zootermopsis nevadensis TaxID=136037 RepID=A0A067RMS6_ZOONE|nr:cytochrome P450 306a1 isoform X2 [Zootermopsis nevadensis]KDR21920.1 Cytochrome P450 306a1 [Zootermopsis nevadensis]
MDVDVSLVFTALLLLCASAFATLLYVHRRGPRLPPGPHGLPIVGFLPWIDPNAPHLTLTRLVKDYGRIYTLKLGSVLTVVLSDHRLIREAFAKDIFTGRAPLFLTHGIMNGYGLICAEGELWKDQRKFVTTCLKTLGMVKFGARRERMENRISVGVQKCLEMLQQKETAGEPQDVLPVIIHCIGNVINSLVFGIVYEENDPTWKWLQRLQEEGTKLIGIAGPVNFLPFVRFLPKYKKHMHYLLGGKVKTHDYYQTIIHDHMKRRKSTPDDGANSPIDDIIDAFLDEKERRGEGEDGLYSTPQLHHLLSDMFGAGVDTTMTTLWWFILFMAGHPDAQKRAQEELDDVVGTRLPTLDDLPLLPYTEAALSETQRIRSVVPVGIPHGTYEATTLGGYHIPKGAMIVPLQWAVHMDPNYWSKPECFNPERFLTHDGRFNKPEFFIPFQTGKRMCVGEELARMLLFLFGATIIHKFNIKAPEGVDVDLEGICGITLTPKHQRLLFSPRF